MMVDGELKLFRRTRITPWLLRAEDATYLDFRTLMDMSDMMYLYTYSPIFAYVRCDTNMWPLGSSYIQPWKSHRSRIGFVALALVFPYARMVRTELELRWS
ncbi:hypothetical protein FRC18_002950 [Serendipita sp. 400]|nr:hypothetical protein FRC18_002950 [Serendipita sp. 400]